MRKLSGYLQSFLINYWQFLPIIISALILGSPFVFSGKVLFWGTVILQFIPWRHYAWNVLLSGHLPLWNPLVGMGAPLFANYQSALLYPPNWFLFLLDSIDGISGLAWGQGFLVVFHWCLAGSGMIYLLKWLKVGKFGQAFGGLSFGLSSYLVGRASFLSINAAVAWLPWIIFFNSKLINEINQSGKPSKHSFFIFTIVIALQLLSGHAQITWYTVLLVFLWNIFWGFLWGREQKCIRNNKHEYSLITKFWIWTAISIIAAGFITSIQLLPTFEYLLQSQRSSAVDAELAMTYSFWPWRFFTLFAPGMFGSPMTGDYWGYGNYWEDALYIGLLPILIVLWVILRRLKNGKLIPMYRLPGAGSMVLFLGILIIISLMLALGKNLPLFPWLYRFVPSFDMFQAPTRISIWAVFAFAILAGFGVEYLRRPALKALYWSRLATAGAFAITLGTGIVWFLFKDVAPTFIRAFTLLGFFGMICGGIVLTAPKDEIVEDGSIQGSANIWRIVVLIFLSFDVIFSNWGLNPVIDPKIFHKIKSSNVLTKENSRLYLPESAEYELKFNHFMRFDTYSPSSGWEKLVTVLLPNMNMIGNIPAVNNFDPLIPASYSRWMDYLEKRENENSSQYSEMLNLMAVGVVEEMDLSSDELIRTRHTSGEQRIRLVDCAIPARDNEHAMEILKNNEISFEKEVIIEGLSNNLEKICLSSAGNNREAEIKLNSDNPNHLTIEINSNNPGWLVLSDIWYPGWVAAIDQEATPIYRANTIFRSVKVEEGHHIVDLDYRPPSFYIGLSLSIISLICIVIFMVLPWKKITDSNIQV